MLIQRYSLKALFAMTTLASFFSLILLHALRGSEWAVAVVVAVAFLILSIVHYAFAFAVIWISTSLGHRRRMTPRSPFARDTPAQQVIPPIS